MYGRKFASLLAPASLCCVAMIACAGDPASPVASTPASSASHTRQLLGMGLGNAHLGSSRSCDTHVASIDVGVFGPQGGTLTFGTSRLIIPGGSLHDTVTISATIPDGDASRVEFRPQGLRFAKPAGLLLDTSGCSTVDTVAPSVVYLSESGEVVETIPAVYDPHWHTIAAPIAHFSGYAIAF